MLIPALAAALNFEPTIQPASMDASSETAPDVWSVPKHLSDEEIDRLVLLRVLEYNEKEQLALTKTELERRKRAWKSLRRNDPELAQLDQRRKLQFAGIGLFGGAGLVGVVAITVPSVPTGCRWVPGEGLLGYGEGLRCDYYLPPRWWLPAAGLSILVLSVTAIPLTVVGNRARRELRNRKLKWFNPSSAIPGLWVSPPGITSTSGAGLRWQGRF